MGLYADKYQRKEVTCAGLSLSQAYLKAPLSCLCKNMCFLVSRKPLLVHFCVVVCELFRVFSISCMIAPVLHTKKHPNLVRNFVLALSWLKITIACVWQSFTQLLQKLRKTDDPLTFLLNNPGLMFSIIFKFSLVFGGLFVKNIVSVHCKKCTFHM